MYKLTFYLRLEIFWAWFISHNIDFSTQHKSKKLNCTPIKKMLLIWVNDSLLGWLSAPGTFSTAIRDQQYQRRRRRFMQWSCWSSLHLATHILHKGGIWLRKYWWSIFVDSNRTLVFGRNGPDTVVIVWWRYQILSVRICRLWGSPA